MSKNICPASNDEAMKMPTNAADIRDRFEELIELEAYGPELDRLCRQLQDCDDMVPGWMSFYILNGHAGTFAEAARAIKDRIAA